MRPLVLGVVALGLAAPVARAQPASPPPATGEELRARGEQLARDGRFTEAIDAFKAAERVEPRARHACLIALAYLRRELWPQAEIFLDQCERRATPADPLPEWFPVAKQQLADRLAQVNVAAVELVVEPAGVPATLAVSSFAPDELFAPRTIHLPPGRHVIVATSPGFDDTQRTVEVTDRTAQRVVITMLPEGAALPAAPPAGAAASTSPRSAVPWIVMGAGGVLVLAGGVTHATLFRTARSELIAADAANDRDRYDAWSRRFDTRRTATLALYGVGAAALVTGFILERTVFARREAPVQVAVEPRGDGGVLTVGWSR